MADDTTVKPAVGLGALEATASNGTEKQANLKNAPMKNNLSSDQLHQVKEATKNPA